MQISASSTLTVYHGCQFWVGLAEHVEDGDTASPASSSAQSRPMRKSCDSLQANGEKLSFFGDKATEASKPAKNPKRRASSSES